MEMHVKVQPTLLRREHPLASVANQFVALEALPLAKSFEQATAQAGHSPLRAAKVETLQINVGKKCNQTCRHCHVDAGPERKEVMPDAVVEACLAVLERSSIATIDVTGGAPELHPRFREIVTRARALGRKVMDRCNLTITQTAGHEDLPEFLAENRVDVVASLPYWSMKQTDAQRGDGVFEASIAALQRLNTAGYARDGSGLVLDLVTNPVGAFLPANQGSLEREWKRELQRRHGVTFNRLYTITNMPISRFLEFLIDSGNLAGYMEKLVTAFNPAAVDGLMCRNLISVGWDGRLYDCDFNQMLEMALPTTIFDLARDGVGVLERREVRTGQHCFGCTAGAGSSCGGATVK